MSVKRTTDVGECCLLCKSFSGRGSSVRKSGWCLCRRLSVDGGFWCSEFRRSSPLRFATEARQVSVMPCTPWE